MTIIPSKNYTLMFGDKKIVLSDAGIWHYYINGVIVDSSFSFDELLERNKIEDITFEEQEH